MPKKPSHTNSSALSLITPQYNTPYLKRLHKMLEVMRDKQAYSLFRHNLIKRQRGIDYQLESDRINGILTNSLLSQTHTNYTRLKNRSKELEELGALAFDRKIPE
jgi:hypothetical protein